MTIYKAVSGFYVVTYKEYIAVSVNRLDAMQYIAKAIFAGKLV